MFINDGEAQNEKESEASAFAADFLLPPQALKAFLEAGELGEQWIIGFAHSQGIAPGIVVGRLQFEGVIRYNQHNHLKKRFEWVAQPPKAA